MLPFLLDTDHLTLLEHGNPLLEQRLLLQPQGTVGFTVVTAAESLHERLASIVRARDSATRLAGWGFFLDSLHIFQQFPQAEADNRVAVKLSRGKESFLTKSASTASSLASI